MWLAEQLIAGADQHVAVALRDRHHVVGHQPVTALDQIEGGFRLADRAAAVKRSPHHIRH